MNPIGKVLDVLAARCASGAHPLGSHRDELSQTLVSRNIAKLGGCQRGLDEKLPI